MPPFVLTAIGWLAGPLGKMALWGIGALVGIGALTAVYFSFVHQIEGRVLAEQKAQRYENVIKEQNELIERQKALMKLQAEISKKLDTDVAETDSSTKSVDEWIASEEAKKTDRKSSLILRQTIKKLGEPTK